MKSSLSFLRDGLQVLRNTNAAAHLGLPTFTGYSWEREAKADCLILKLLATHDDGIHERINERAALAARIAKCAENGKVLIVESGRDCDCVEYSGHCHEIDATVNAYWKLYKETAEWADGPFRFAVCRPSEAPNIRAESRDLVMEAFEDGHPHSIVSRFA